MRLNNLVLIIILNVITLVYLGQSSESEELKCEKILQEVSDNIQKNNASKFNFKLEIKSEDINEIQNGYALIEKEKFYYKTEEREVICDGINVWTYLPEDNECYIDLLEDLDNTLNPSEIFTMWKEGFKYMYVKKILVNNQTIHKIKMFPSQPDKSNFHTIIMDINESLKLISEASVKTKDGVTIKTTITELISNPKINVKQFSWDENSHPNTDEIDNR
ncbi:outer membrane lipoprotein carrier protein LolA [Flavobacteriales bacterium]|nr:outer membrane lipoprotein carrier protein LolA [Flavobacteriales bacterium]